MSTCSYEERKYGVHSAVQILQDYKFYPDYVFMPVNMQLYKDVLANIMEILRELPDKLFYEICF